MSAGQYISYPIARLHHSEALPGDLYIFVAGKFVKLIHRGDELPVEKFDWFILKNIQFVFIHSSDLELFKSWYMKVKESLDSADKQSIGEESGPLFDLYSDVRDEFLNFITTDITDENIKTLVAKTKRIAQEVLKTITVAEMVTKMQKLSPSLVDHATNVANMSIFVGINSGYSHQLLLENLYLGGLLHDYGKISVARNFSGDDESQEFQNAMKEHPTVGRSMLMAETGFGDEILDIVAQHHERFDGEGFPNKLRGAQVYELAKIVSLANVFDHLVREGSGGLKNRQLMALKMINKDDREQFDPRVLKKFVKTMEHVITH